MPTLRTTRVRVAANSRNNIAEIAAAAAQSYVAAVEAADGAALEPAVATALRTLAEWRIPLGGQCWAGCGARTIAGALTPMVGPAPTGVNLVSGDYSRTQGITAAAGKYIATNRFPSDIGVRGNAHFYTWVPKATTAPTAFRVLFGGIFTAGGCGLRRVNTGPLDYHARVQYAGAILSPITVGTPIGVFGAGLNEPVYESQFGDATREEVTVAATPDPTTTVNVLADSGGVVGYVGGSVTIVSNGRYIDRSAISTRFGDFMAAVISGVTP